MATGNFSYGTWTSKKGNIKNISNRYISHFPVESYQ